MAGGGIRSSINVTHICLRILPAFSLRLTTRHGYGFGGPCGVLAIMTGFPMTRPFVMVIRSWHFFPLQRELDGADEVRSKELTRYHTAEAGPLRRRRLTNDQTPFTVRAGKKGRGIFTVVIHGSVA